MTLIPETTSPPVSVTNLCNKFLNLSNRGVTLKRRDNQVGYWGEGGGEGGGEDKVTHLSDP